MTCHAETAQDKALAFIVTDSGELHYFCCEFNGERYQAVFPASWSALGHDFATQAQCIEYINHQIHGIELWASLQHITVCHGVTEQDWHTFPKGTRVEAIWIWFEREFNVAVESDLMFNPDAKKMLHRLSYQHGQIIGFDNKASHSRYAITVYTEDGQQGYIGCEPRHWTHGFAADGSERYRSVSEWLASVQHEAWFQPACDLSKGD